MSLPSHPEMRLPDQAQILLVPVLCLALIGGAWWLLRGDAEPEPEPVATLRVLCDEAFRHAAAEVAEAFERRGRGAVDARYLPAGELLPALGQGGWDLVVAGPELSEEEFAEIAALAPGQEEDAPPETGDDGGPTPPRARMLEGAGDPALAAAFARFFNGPVGREAFFKHRPAAP